MNKAQNELSESALALDEARQILGSFAKVGAVCGTSGKAVQKWRNAGRLPRTEYSGETDYARRIERATNYKVTVERLLRFDRAPNSRTEDQAA